MFDSVEDAVTAYRAANEAQAALDVRRDWEKWKAVHQGRHAMTDYLRARGRADLLYPLAMESATFGKPGEHTAWIAQTDALLR
jgi:hypothetical protein